MNFKNSITCFISILLLTFSCRQESAKTPDIVEDSIQNPINLVDTSEINQVDTVVQRSYPLHDTIQQFLKEPFDLTRYKEIKRSSNSGIGSIESYYFKPDYEGFYYQYFLFHDLMRKGYLGQDKSNRVYRKDAITLVVYKKKGEYQAEFNDPTEQLMEVRAKLNDTDLPELAYVGWRKDEVIKKLGKPSFRKEDCLVYAYENNALVLKIADNKVKWLKYSRLNFNLSSESQVPELYEISDFW